MAMLLSICVFVSVFVSLQNDDTIHPMWTTNLCFIICLIAAIVQEKLLC